MMICIGPFCIPVAGLFPFLAAIAVTIKHYIYSFFFPETEGNKKTDALTDDASGQFFKLNSESQFADLLQSHDKLVLDFTATWCKPCQTVAPLFHSLSDRYTNVCFVSIDVDEFEDLAAKYKVSAMPTFVSLHKQKEVGRVMGAMPRDIENLVTNVANV